MSLIHSGLRGRLSILILAALCAGAPVFAAQKVSSTTFDTTTTATVITGNGGGNGNQTGQGQANGVDNGNGQKNGMTTGTATGTTAATTASFVSPVPEPSDYALMLTGLALLIAGVKRRRRASPSESAASA